MREGFLIVNLSCDVEDFERRERLRIGTTLARQTGVVEHDGEGLAREGERTLALFSMF